MLIDDLEDYGRGRTDTDRQIRNKMQADMVYYAVLKEMLSDYGTELTRDITKVHPDGLGAARDQMAMRASDQGLIAYTGGGRIDRFIVPGRNGERDRSYPELTGEALETFVRQAFLNSEALRNMVATSIAGRNGYPADRMNEDGLVEMTEREFSERVLSDDADSPYSRVLRTVRGFSQTMGITERGERGDTDHDLTAFSAPDETLDVVPDGSAWVRRADGTGRHGCLKISPLMPEIRDLRMLGVPGGIAQARVERLGLYHTPSDAETQNGVLQFDGQKRLLEPAHASYSEYLAVSPETEFRDGVLIGETAFGQNATRQVTETVTTYDSGANYDTDDDLVADTVTRATRTVRVYDRNVKQGSDMNLLFAWRMAETLERYSQRELTDNDYDTVGRIFLDSTHAGGFGQRGSTVFGNPAQAGYDVVAGNADRYFDYLEHVCGTARQAIPSHEFEIHFTRQDGFEGRDGFVPLLFFTGMHTDDYNKARADSSRFLGVYPYVNYTPRQMGTSPVAGDVTFGSFNSFTVTNRNFREGRPEDSPYAHMSRITPEMVTGMRETFDSAVAGRQSPNVALAKVMKPVGGDGPNDLVAYILPSGRVDGEAVAQALRGDMEAIKEEHRADFLRPESRRRIGNVFSSFIAEQCGEDENANMDTAIRNFAAAKRSRQDAEGFRRALSGELERLASRELRESYGQDVSSYMATRHIWNRYLGAFAAECTGIADSGLQMGGAPAPDLIAVAFSGSLAQEAADRTLDRLGDEDLDGALFDLFGGDGPDGRFAIRANMCRRSSRRFTQGEYDDLLSLLSYSRYADYRAEIGEPDPFDGTAPCRVCLYAAEAYTAEKCAARVLSVDDGATEPVLGMEGIDDDPDNPDTDDEDAGADYRSLQDERTWFDTTFARVGGEGDRTLEWALTVPPESDPDARLEHAVWTASNPLKIEAMRRISSAVPDAERIGVTEQGVVYALDGDGEPILKAGPVIDEVAWIRPYITETDASDPQAFAVRVPEMNDMGYPVRDAQGKEILRDAYVHWDYGESERCVVGANGQLLNEVVPGSLDVPGRNRFYGISAKVANYDGYDHRGKEMWQRLSYSTYQTGVLEGISRAAAMYNAAGRSGSAMARSLLYTNVNGGSLNKYYRTNTYIIEDPAKCAAGGAYLENLTYKGEADWSDLAPYLDPEHPEECAKAGNLLAAQSGMYHNRVVMKGATIDENVGLYTQLANLQQMEAKHAIGNFGRKNMRQTDMNGARVGALGPNPVFDFLSGSAKKLGTVMFFTDAVRFDPMTGRMEYDPSAGPEARCAFPALGITDFATGNVEARLSDFPGGQAVDRLQLSMNAIEKSLHVSEATFAMINLGYNDEDGYVVAKRSAEKFGHFDSEGRFVPLEQWDKIGDTESGNKGVVAKIVDTDIGEGMDDEHAERAFLSDFTYKYLQTFPFSHGDGDPALCGDFEAALRQAVMGEAGIDIDPKEWFLSRPSEDGTVGESLDHLRLVLAGKTADLAADFGKGLTRAEAGAAAKEDIRASLTEPMAAVGERLLASGVEPFTGSYKLERDVWRLFRDNPDLDMAVTNACVCTRSNPSILMHIQEPLEKDLAAAKAAGAADAGEWIREHGSSALTVRDAEGEKKTLAGARGRFTVYTDSHTAEDKNKDYNEISSKPGRAVGAQELYALTAKHCTGDFFGYLCANDATLPGRIAKYDRKIMMNGFYADLSDPDFTIKRLGPALDTASVDADGFSPEFPGMRFVDMNELADRVLEGFADRKPPQKDMDAAIRALGESADFSPLLSLKAGKGAKVKGPEATDTLRRMFTREFGRYSGGFMLLPENLEGVSLRADIGLTVKSRDGEETDWVRMSGNVGTESGERTAAPLFLSSRETADPDTGTVAVSVDDKIQFSIFKSALAAAVAGKVAKMEDADGFPYASGEVCEEAAGKLGSRITAQYKKVPQRQSMSLDGMNGWLKKNVYRTVTADSLTCVWSGNPCMEIDEAGLSFEKAKSLGLLRTKEGLSEEELRGIPDTFEFMSERYEPLTDDDLVLVNRSPGQTTGCMRAFRARITRAEGGGLEINPACATIFDGDFDGDTVGVCNPAKAVGLKDDPNHEEMWKQAREELKARMTMQANMCHTADYTSLTNPDGSEIGYVYPLFIAKNADYAVAMNNMGQGVKDELDTVTAAANLTEHLRQCKYDAENVAAGRIGAEDGAGIVAERVKQIGALRGWLAAGEHDTDSAWSGTVEKIDGIAKGVLEAKSPKEALLAASKISLRDTAKAETETFRHMAAAYREMTGHITEPSCVVNGETPHEMVDSIIRDANVCKKGKEPQLNALLMFGGVHEKCGGNLRVAADENKKFTLLTDGKPTDGVYDGSIRMDPAKAVSDLPKSDFRDSVQYNLLAQAGKSDATGLGGAMAQKMQKVLAGLGYGETALALSGPVTQSFLDSKQNAATCATRANIGKFELNDVCRFKKVKELLPEAGQKDPWQVFKGQATRTDEWMDAAGCVTQMDSFRKAMGLSGLSPWEKSGMTACLKTYAGQDGIVRDPVRAADRQGDVTFASMYGGDNTYAQQLRSMADDGKGLFYESSFDGRIDSARIASVLIEDALKEDYRFDREKPDVSVAAQERREAVAEVREEKASAKEETKKPAGRTKLEELFSTLKSSMEPAGTEDPKPDIPY